MSTDIDLDHYIATRQAVLLAWERWDEQPGNTSRAIAFEEALQAYAGDSATEFRKFVAAVRRAGGANRESALTAWESDW
jgi:hypothetical protein